MASPVTQSREADAFVDRIEASVRAQNPDNICAGVKTALKELAAEGASWIPEDYLGGSDDGYTRRILHQCPERSYSVLLMVWRPGQGTDIHDHAGKWCVECVIRGRIEVVSQKLLGQEEDLFRFEEAGRELTTVGDVGILIPPNEYHRLSNVGETTAATIHVYEGEMLWCNRFLPTDVAGTFRRDRCTLSVEE